jgi:hypothetical protein
MSLSEGMSADSRDLYDDSGDVLEEGMIFPISAYRHEFMRDRTDTSTIQGDPIVLSFEQGKKWATMTPRDKMNVLLQHQRSQQRSRSVPNVAPTPTINTVQTAIDRLTISSEEGKSVEFMISAVLDVFAMVTHNCPPLSDHAALALKLVIIMEFLRRKVISDQCTNQLVECFYTSAEADWVS